MRTLFETLSSNIPADRRHALAQGVGLPDRTWGAALFADISGFTPLAEALSLEHGPQRGAEELTRVLNAALDALISESDRYGGSVIGFSGDAITCWFDGDDGLRATTCGWEMQKALEPFASVVTPTGQRRSLGMKAAVATGATRRFLVGDPEIQLIDVLAGSLMDELATVEGLAQEGQVLLTPATLAALGDRVRMASEVTGVGGARFGAVAGLSTTASPRPWPALIANSLAEAEMRRWLLPPLQQRMEGGQVEFIAELRLAAALFLRFGGIDYDDDDRAGERLDAFIRWVQRVLAHYESYVLQLTIGDKGSYVYASFGAPLAHEDDAVRAVSAALELSNLPPDLRFVEGIQIGISQGNMRVGNNGGMTRTTYSVQGTEANVAARLMMTAKPGQILVTQRVAERCGARFKFQAPLELEVKGLKRPVTVFTVAAKPEAAARPSLSGAPGDPMIGRQVERQLLNDALQDLIDGSPPTIVIEGEAGIGKSRLLHDLGEKARERSIPIMFGIGDPVERTNPYYAWRPVVRDLFGLGEVRDVTEMRAQVLDSLAREPRLRERAPLLNAFIPLDLPESQLTAPMSGELRASNTRDLLVQLLARKTADSPAVLVLEDAHWFDSASWSLAEQVQSRVSSLLIVVATRPLLATEMPGGGHLSAALGQFLGYPRVRRVHLAALTPEETKQLIVNRLGVSSVPQPVIDWILELAEGHPFFSEEIANALRDKRILIIEHGEARLAAGVGDLRELDFPDTIQGVVTSRLDLLPPEHLLSLKVASVIGRVFPFATVQRVHPDEIEIPKLRAQFDYLERLDITPLEVIGPPAAYAFKHILIQESVYKLLLFSQRAQLHRAVAETLEQESAPDLTALYPSLSHHWGIVAELGADDRGAAEKAIHYLDKAGEQAIRNYANQEAARFLTEALTLSEKRGLPIEPSQRARWERQLGEAYLALGDLGETQIHLKRSVKILGLPASPTPLHLIGRFQLELIRQVLHRVWSSRFIGSRPDLAERNSELARAYERLGFVHYFKAEAVALLAGGLRILNLSETAGLASRELAGAYATNSYTAGLLGLRRLAGAYHQRGRELSERIDDLPSLIWVLIAWGLYNLGVGGWEACTQVFQEAEQGARRLQDNRRLEECLTLWGMAEYYQGLFDSSVARSAETFAVASISGNAQGKIWGLFGEAEILVARGQLVEGAKALEEGLELLEHVLDRLEEIRGFGLLARARLYEGQQQAALKAAREASNRIAKLLIPTGYYLLEGYAGAAEVYLRLWEAGGLASAEQRTLTREAIRACRALRWFGLFFPIGRPQALLWQGVLDWQRGRTSRGLQTWRKALERADQLRMPYVAGLIHAELGRRLAPDDPSKQVHQDKARELLTRLQASDHLPELEK
jgi:class 3 adenylate cyclase